MKNSLDNLHSSLLIHENHVSFLPRMICIIANRLINVELLHNSPNMYFKSQIVVEQKKYPNL